MKHIWLLPLLMLTNCTVKSTWLKSDYAATDRLKLKRIVVLTENSNLQKPALAELMNSLAAEYISHHKEYILKLDKTASWQNACKKGEIDGYVKNSFLQKPEQGSKLLLDLESVLYNCQNAPVWKVRAVKSWPAAEVSNSIVRANTAKFGRETGIYIYPFYNIVRKALKKMPNPKLNEADVMEKIDSDSLLLY